MSAHQYTHPQPTCNPISLAAVPADLLADPALPALAKLIAVNLPRLARSTDREIAQILGHSPGHVQRCLGHLTRAGWVRRLRQAGRRILTAVWAPPAPEPSPAAAPPSAPARIPEPHHSAPARNPEPPPSAPALKPPLPPSAPARNPEPEGRAPAPTSMPSPSAPARHPTPAAEETRAWAPAPAPACASYDRERNRERLRTPTCADPNPQRVGRGMERPNGALKAMWDQIRAKAQARDTATAEKTVERRQLPSQADTLLSPQERERAQQLSPRAWERLVAALERNDPVLLAEARRVLGPPPEPAPDPRTLPVETLIDQLPGRWDLVPVLAIRIAQDLNDQESFKFYEKRLTGVAQRAVPVAVLHHAWEVANRPGWHKPGAGFHRGWTEAERGTRP